MNDKDLMTLAIAADDIQSAYELISQLVTSNPHNARLIELFKMIYEVDTFINGDDETDGFKKNPDEYDLIPEPPDQYSTHML